jgi:2-oxoglutarate dehydrogenase E1 component
MSIASSQARQSGATATALPADWHDPLAAAFRRWGHLQAETDPVGRIQPEVHPDLADLVQAGAPERVDALRRAYCGSIGAEFMHIRDRERAIWLAQRLEDPAPAPVDRARVIRRLMEAELFERFLHKRYVGSKRYSLEGNTGLILLLDAVLDTAAVERMEIALLCMSHRGRLTVMVNTVGVPPEALFAGLEDVDPRASLGAGDVKYHLGATGVHRRPEGGDVRVHLASNPSHLEAVNPVLMGRARARQTRLGDDGPRKVLPICLHGDAAFAGQGITSETLNLAGLPGYDVGGTIQIIVNNLIGFTAEPASLHSSRYSSDAIKRIEVPVLHVNAEDPQAIERAGRIAVEYRQRFGSDVLIDLVGFRRYGHSEVEDPTTTSPLLYAGLQDRPLLYEQIARQWDIDETSLEAERQEIEKRYAHAQETGRSHTKRPPLSTLPYYWDGYSGGQYDPDAEVDTSVDSQLLEEIAAALTDLPEDFHVHPKVEKFLDQRAKMLMGETALDFGTAEAAAFGSLLREGRLVRLTGQDSCRGTFNHRNAVLVDVHDGHRYAPLSRLAREGARLDIYDSPLSEAAVLGYEYGFSRDFPDALVAWEAQFGDFVNGAQIIIDQFLAAGEDKWRLLSGLVMLLPHGYEGQGPEHSSARLERFLQLASEHNLQIAQPSTAAQYFHLLRRQVLRRWRKPLVVFTPKSMLRAKASSSERAELIQGRFERILVDAPQDDVDRILLCSGKIVHELRAERARREDLRTAIVSIEQLYPVPEQEIHGALVRLASARKVVWVQEEPANMGALATIRPELQRLAGGRHVTSVKRSPSASPATGSSKAHKMEQEALIRLAFS